jgi:hypothetical protein
MCYTQNRFKALISACVMSLIATAGWSQSLTWLGTLPGGGRREAYGVSADGSVVVGVAYNAARVLACLSLDGVWWHARPRHAGRRWELGFVVFPPMAPWWSAGLTTPHGMVAPFAGRWMVGMQDLGTLPGGNGS